MTVFACRPQEKFYGQINNLTLILGQVTNVTAHSAQVQTDSEQ